MLKNKKKTTKEVGLKTYGYIRVSTDEQAETGISLAMQKKKVCSYAKLMDLNLVEIVEDKGESGKDLDRPGLIKLLDMVGNENPDVVVVYKLDRLSRKTRDLLFLIEETFYNGNTRFISLTEQIDTKTAMGKFFLTIMAGMAQMERELIVERTKAALEHKKQLGYSLGHTPYGHDKKNNKLIRNEEEQKIIEKMKRWRRQNKSYNKIAKLLNLQGVPVKSKNAKWHASSIWYVLNRKKVEGTG